MRRGATAREAPLLMGLDLGTTFSKGVVMGADGREYASARRMNRYDHPAEGWVEMEAGKWLDEVFGLIRELAAAAPGPVRALAFSCASGNTLLCDEEGRPVTSIINWMDQRAAR